MDYKSVKREVARIIENPSKYLENFSYASPETALALTVYGTMIAKGVTNVTDEMVKEVANSYNSPLTKTSSNSFLRLS